MTSTAQHSTAQHSAAQRAQHSNSTAQRTCSNSQRASLMEIAGGFSLRPGGR